MKFRTHLLAGLIAAVPALASAAPYVGIGELQQRAELGLGTGSSGSGRTPEFYRKHQEAMGVGVSHIEASMHAARALRDGSSTPGTDEAWMGRHKREMDRGVSHIDASTAASHK